MVWGPYPLWYGLVVVLVAAGLLLTPTVEPPRSWLLLGLTLATIGGGVHFLVRGHPGYRFYLRKPTTLLYWITPLALALGGALFTLQLLGGHYTALGMLTTAAGVAVLIYIQLLSARPEEPAPALARLTANLSVYLAAFLFFVALLHSELGLLLKAALFGGVSWLLSLELFRKAADRPEREVLYAAVAALLIVELGVGLQLLPLGEVLTGLLLLLAFYLLSGLIHNHLMNRLSPGVALEFVGVTAVGLGFLYGFRAMGG